MENNFIEPCRDTIEFFIKAVFGDCEGYISLRSFSEKGSARKTPFFHWVENDVTAIDKVLEFARSTNNRRMSCFCIPGTVLQRGQALAAEIHQMQTVLVDIDDGDSEAKLAEASSFFGEPSFVVESGGITEVTKPKLHAYWRLPKPVSGEDLQRLLRIRHKIAEKIGSDLCFQSAHQPIRIAGSVYHKTQPSKLVKIKGGNNA